MKKLVSYVVVVSALLIANISGNCQIVSSTKKVETTKKEEATKKVETTTSKEKIIPSTSFQNPRAKFFEITYRNYPFANENLQNEPDNDDDYDGKMLIAKLRFPIVMSKKFNLIGEAGYNREVIYVPQSAGGFGKMDFHKIGLTLIGEKVLDNDRFVLGVVSLSNKTEIETNRANFVPNNISTLAMYGKKMGSYDKYAAGISFASSIGRLRVSPVFAFSKRINNRNFIEALLPKRVSYKHIMSDEFYLFASFGANKSNYDFSEERTIGETNNLEVRRTEIGFNMGLERELHDWLWVSFNAGIVKPMRNAIVENGQRTRDLVGALNTSIQPTLSISVYGVIPQKLLKKIGGN